jgi:hypothetical protein
MCVSFLTTDFVTMFEEDKWPDDPIEYARGFLGSTSREDIDAAVAENARLKSEAQALEAQVAEAQRQLDTHTP